MIRHNSFRSGILIFICMFPVFFPTIHVSGKEEAQNPGISIEEAILRALENNQAFHIERINPEIQKTYVEEEKAVFDPAVGVDVTRSKSTLASGIAALTRIERENNNAEVTKKFSTGTELSAGIETERIESERSGNVSSATGVVTLNQPLLKNFGRGPNLANLRKAKLSLLASEYELRGFAESLVANVEKTCWDYVLARRRISIFQESLQLAEDQLEETRKRIKIGKLANVEVYAAEAEVALRKEALINARSDLDLIRLRLQRLINSGGINPLESAINISDKPFVAEADINTISEHIQRALGMRPEVNQAKLDLKQDEIEIVRTKNGLLPLLNFFIAVGKTGYAESFGNAFQNIDKGKYDISTGITFNFPVMRRAERARYKRSLFSREQSEEALKNLEQLVEVDVRSALIEINRAEEQVSATAATRKLQKESFRAETEKFRVGKSTNLLLARAQRDFVASQITEIEALITYLKAVIDFYHKEGTLLIRRGISCPGDEPVSLSTTEIRQ